MLITRRVKLIPLILVSCNNTSAFAIHRPFSTVNMNTASSTSSSIHTADMTSSTPSPSSTMLNSTWRSTIDSSIAESRTIRGSNYVQLSSVCSESNEARCRTVVFRGFSEAEGSTSPSQDAKLKFCTDLRSTKVLELKKNPSAEVVWWLPHTSEQFRVRGNVLFQDTGDEREVLWSKLSQEAKDSFLIDRIPGDDFITNEEMGAPASGNKSNGISENFLLMLLEPKRIDRLQLSNNKREIWEKMENNNWIHKRVNP